MTVPAQLSQRTFHILLMPLLLQQLLPSHHPWTLQQHPAHLKSPCGSSNHLLQPSQQQPWTALTHLLVLRPQHMCHMQQAMAMQGSTAGKQQQTPPSNLVTVATASQ